MSFVGSEEQVRNMAKNVAQEVATVLAKEIEESFEKRFTALEAHAKKMETLLNQINGASKLVRTLFWIVAPLMGLIYWVKDHVRL